MITIQLLGGACLRSGQVPIGGPPAQRHRIALLTLMVVTERTGAAYGIKGSFLLASLHAHPRFRTLLERMRLA